MSLSVAHYCPYCGDQDLWPQADPPGAWRCRSCTRAFVVKKVRTTPAEPAPDSEPEH